MEITRNVKKGKGTEMIGTKKRGIEVNKFKRESERTEKGKGKGGVEIKREGE